MVVIFLITTISTTTLLENIVERNNCYCRYYFSFVSNKHVNNTKNPAVNTQHTSETK